MTSNHLNTRGKDEANNLTTQLSKQILKKEILLESSRER